jgi:hypothetical protein
MKCFAHVVWHYSVYCSQLLRCRAGGSQVGVQQCRMLHSRWPGAALCPCCDYPAGNPRTRRGHSLESLHSKCSCRAASAEKA